MSTTIILSNLYKLFPFRLIRHVYCLVTNNNTLDGSGQKSSDIFLCTQIIATLHLNSITTCDRDVFLGNDIDKKVQFCRNAESTCLVPAKFASFGAVCVRYCQFLEGKFANQLTWMQNRFTSDCQVIIG